MSIWFRDYTLEEVQRRGNGTMVEYLGIMITELGPDYMRGTMPVDHRTIQPMGILHGGASITLAETLGSLAANLVVNPERYSCVGLDINGNHVRTVPINGIVSGTAKPLHLGKTTHVWSIEISDPNERLVCISRLTMAVLEKKIGKL